ncbi:ParB/RepB/Spo0J family partition protein [Streptomyces sp. NPDC059802]|uniref:ParB/RepB/Spo0J family partition protein n=1 Tax=Streptomyces sp. NPDC059802 TaxID=3346952 RepID=UPI00364C3099
MPIDSLRPSDSPRLMGIDEDHVRVIADSGKELQPILAHRSTMRIIDGMHRFKAALMRGDTTISVCYFDGEAEAAFILAVRANNAHGLPLTLADRKSAAARIIASHPEFSHRSIAGIVGLSATTISNVRRSAADPDHVQGRIGRDGRFRPTSTVEGRRLAGDLIAARPQASLREIAHEVGLSLGTVKDVRDLVRRGEDPVRQPRASKPTKNSLPANSLKESAEAKVPDLVAADVASAWRKLSRDPSLRFAESGRRLLRLLSAHSIDFEMVDAAPAHCSGNIVLLARQCARALTDLADRVEQGGR